MGDVGRQIAEPPHHLALVADDAADLASAEALAPLARTARAEELFGGLGLFAEAFCLSSCSFSFSKEELMIV